MSLTQRDKPKKTFRQRLVLGLWEALIFIPVIFAIDQIAFRVSGENPDSHLVFVARSPVVFLLGAVILFLGIRAILSLSLHRFKIVGALFAAIGAAIVYGSYFYPSV